MDDVADIIAGFVLRDVDHVTWTVDDVAAAAGVLATDGSRELRSVSAAIWRGLARLPVAGVLACLDGPMPLSDGVRNVDLRRLVRSATGGDPGSRAKTADLRDRLQRCKDEDVGRSCPVPVELAHALLRCRKAKIASSRAQRHLGVPPDHPCLAERTGAPYGGTYVCLWQARAAVRSIMAAEDSARSRIRIDRLVQSTSEHVQRALRRAELVLRRETARRMCQNACPDPVLARHLANLREVRDYCNTGKTTAEAAASAVDTFCARMRNLDLDVGDVVHAFATTFGMRYDPDSIFHRALRHRTLRRALAERGLEIRRDSVACRRYLDATRDDLEAVVDVMDEMRFFFERTDYSTIAQRLRPRRTWGDDDGDFRADVYDPVAISARAKREALLKLDGVPADAPSNVRALAADLGVRVVPI